MPKLLMEQSLKGTIDSKQRTNEKDINDSYFSQRDGEYR
jgi:hypothetical protein